MTVAAGPLSVQVQGEVGEVLTAEQMALFETQSSASQQHGYRVMQTLVSEGHDERPLLTAALLHDVGKVGQRYSWLDRVRVVLAQRFAPTWAEKWASGPENRWTRAFVIKANHAQWSANEVANVGGSDLCVALVRRHHEATSSQSEDSEEERLLALLQRADDRN